MKIQMVPTTRRAKIKWYGETLYRKIYRGDDGKEYVTLGKMSLYQPNACISLEHINDYEVI